MTSDSLRFKAASLNLRRQHWALDDHGSWADALASLLAWNKEHDADIVCLQQVPTDLFDSLGGILSMGSVRSARSRLEGWEDGCMVLWNPLSFELTAKESFWVSNSPSMPGSTAFPDLEPRGGAAAALHHEGYHLRVVSTSWEPDGATHMSESKHSARIMAACVIKSLLGSGANEDSDFRAFSTETLGMPSLIAGGFEEVQGLKMGRAVLEQEGFAPVFNLSYSMDDVLSSPGIKLLEVLDSGGVNGSRPMLAEFEISERQDYGVPVRSDPPPVDFERHKWPEEELERPAETAKSDEPNAAIK